MTYRRGARGDGVRELQRLLGLSQCDGIFGRGTEKAVKSFQELFGLEADGIVGPATWKALRTAGTKTPPQPLPPVLVHIQSLGHKIMWDGDYHLNLFGIRNPDPMSNSFDDMMGCAYTVDSMWKVHYWPATCDPGTYHLQNPSRVDGTAILAPGQYEDVWTIDLHAGKYEALCQRNGPVVVFRDSDKDYLLEMDEGSQVEGYFGINLHRSSLRTDTVEEVEDAEVNRWSAGCQVHARNDGFNEMMGLARMQVEKLGRTTFTYTLLNQWWE